MKYSLLVFYSIFSSVKKQLNAEHQNILLHEKAHASQRHTWDILLLELVQIFYWFNPFLAWYKYAIKLNHEFLADQSVLKHTGDIRHYQNQILTFITQAQTHDLASNFSFKLTKKRLIMMTKETYKTKISMLSVSTLPFFLLAFLLFSQKNFAQKIDSAATNLTQQLEKPIRTKTKTTTTTIKGLSNIDKIMIESQDTEGKTDELQQLNTIKITNDGLAKKIIINDSIEIDLKDGDKRTLVLSKENLSKIEDLKPHQIKRVFVQKNKDGSQVFIINDSLKLTHHLDSGEWDKFFKDDSLTLKKTKIN